ncbi:signal peptidase II Aspartic peptidase. MEROPS family A08 [Marinilactibacillus piezotolerans]|uniref:Lipoprotein signal peptidase n=1 Tax=Marinilactibacillus piezotolerans TaxID=258723 RepID=A0A1I4BF41_9LACT|nr:MULTISPECIES: signal peptidase II [Marinilactibacillus]SFK66910.1 signal peptidase II Aspartic peptidase. MEROPS family A08 [Marinilactibacillus piezotolerans]
MFYIIAVIVLIIDQLWKSAIVKWMEVGQTIPLWEGVFHITSLRNKGAAFGILQGQRWFFIIVTLIVVLGIIYYLQTEGRNNRRISFALSLLLGGALGNFFDRLIRGEVVDSLDFRLIDYPIFNLADVFIVSGVALMILDMWLETRTGQQKQENEKV